ncbi:Hypothetical protein NTJ_09240 [Nesidiocoris tenuis]|uniref:Uncharacterized protein n=1 Tax=Nesidiocoris tenuis TaxID=355587 RepID=A0ABN7AW60_9HEMI|nr:Hypothetical protein NTJ_09240 [Nesidiocoris tenuis]
MIVGDCCKRGFLQFEISVVKSLREFVSPLGDNVGKSEKRPTDPTVKCSLFAPRNKKIKCDGKNVLTSQTKPRPNPSWLPGLVVGPDAGRPPMMILLLLLLLTTALYNRFHCTHARASLAAPTPGPHQQPPSGGKSRVAQRGDSV